MYHAMMQQLAPQPPEDLEPVMQGYAKQEVARLLAEREVTPPPPHVPSASTIYQLLLSYTEFLEREKPARAQLPAAIQAEVVAAVRTQTFAR
jgi:hypothetical protein